MTTRKTTTKVSKKVDLDLNIDNKTNKRTQSKIKKQFKKLKFTTILLSVFIMTFGAVGGFFGVKYLTRNDCFEIIGQDEITLQVGEKYVDDKVKIIAFGKDVSDDIVIETNLKQNDDGSYYADKEQTYYIVYKSKNFKYNSLFKVKKIRLIHFVDATEESEMIGGGNNE